jgi:hypothetical protein
VRAAFPVVGSTQPCADADVGLVELEISLTEAQLARIVDNTFLDADLDHNGVIDLNEYQVRPCCC